ncbi:MAG: autotransporter outer membrane beta-barrel domain-containing protein [Gammaproteobacteria bacterium AqS3]|nr:autotransporter outer membrane beta-barrel domain-containing protein [Gammaproteobacteria bacterium AqS3]
MPTFKWLRYDGNTSTSPDDFQTSDPGKQTVTVEEEGTATLSVRLNAPPTANVLVTLSKSGTHSARVSFDADASTSGVQNTMTFTPSNYSVSQTVTFSATHDDDQANEIDAATITFTLASSDTQYGGETFEAQINIDDDDEVELKTFVDSKESTTLEFPEEDGSGTFGVRLGSLPTGNVTVSLTVAADNVAYSDAVSIDKDELIFTTANWRTPQTVTVSATADADGANLKAKVTLDPSGGGYDALPDVTMNVEVKDDEVPGLNVSKTALYLTEGGAAATFTISLATPPSYTHIDSGTGNPATKGVRVQVRRIDDPTRNDRGDFSSSNIVNPCNAEETEAITVTSPAFNPSASCAIQFFPTREADEPEKSLWNEAQTITITPDDETDASNKADLISRYVIRIQGTDSDDKRAPEYDPSSLWKHIDLEILDDDVPQLLAAVSDGGGGETPQNGQTFTLDLNEGLSQVYKIKLSSAPGTGGATVTPSVAAGSGVEFAPASLIFTDSNFGNSQDLTISAQTDDDVDDESATVTLTLAPTTGTSFEPRTRNISVSVEDLTMRDFVTAGSVPNLVEPDDPTAAITPQVLAVKLGSEPTADVTVTLSVDNPKITLDTDISTPGIQNDPLTFTSSPSSWSTAQEVHVSTTHDPDGGDETATITLTGAGGDYDSLTKTVTVRVEDRDIATATISALTRTMINEGSSSMGSADFTVALGLVPSADVTVTLEASDSDAVELDGDLSRTGNQNTLTFTPTMAAPEDVASGNCTTEWNCPQTIRIRAVEDDDTDHETVRITLEGSGAVEYTDAGGFTFDSTTIRVTDNDTPGVTVSNRLLQVSEAGETSQTFDIVLNTRPADDTVIRLDNSDKSTDGSVEITTSGALNDRVTFTPTNARTPQTVTVTAEEDADAESERVTISLNVDDGPTEYTRLNLADYSVTVEVTDDDTAGLDLSTQTLDLVEGGASGTFRVNLKSKPTADVTVTLTSSDSGAVVVDTDNNPSNGNQSTLTFTSSDASETDVMNRNCSGQWNCPLTVSVLPVDDDDILSENGVMISFAFTGSAAEYTSLAPISKVTVRVDDDDAGGLTLSKSTINLLTESTSISGAQNTDTFTVALSRQPQSNVTVVLSTSDTAAVGVSPATLTFSGGSTGNWGTAQTVTLTAGDDYDAVSEAGVEINLLASGSPEFVGVTGQVTVTSVTDDDTASIDPVNVVTNTDGDLELREEDSTGEIFGVKLGSEPNGEVTVTVGTNAAGVGVATVSPSTLTFSVGDWRAPKSIRVTPVHDLDAVDEKFAITLDAAGADYDDVAQARVDVKVVDGQEAGVTLSTSALTVDESGSATFDVSLATPPAGAQNVVVTVTRQVDSDVWVDTDISTPNTRDTGLTFTSSNWNTPQSVTVGAESDDDGADDTATITLSAEYSPNDPDFNDYRSCAGVTGLCQTVSSQLIVTVTDDDDRELTLSSSTLTVDEQAEHTSSVVGSADNQFTVSLNTQPTAGVLVTLKQPTDNTDVRVDVDLGTPGYQNTLTFSTSKANDVSADCTAQATHWNCPRTVTVIAEKDDDATGGETGTINLSAAGGDYGSQTKDVTVTITESDARSFKFDPANRMVDLTEGAGATFKVKLDAKPVGGNVTVALAKTGDTETTFTPASMTFTDADWDDYQTVRVSAAHDSDAEDEKATITFSVDGTPSSDYVTEGLTGDTDVTINVADDDVPGWEVKQGAVTLSATSTIALKEADSSSDPNYSMRSQTITVKPVFQPDQTITAQLITTPVGNDPAITFLDQGGNTITELEFTTSTWNTAQSVEIVAVSDGNAQDEDITITVTGKTGSGNYEDVTRNGVFKVTVEDDETAGVVVVDALDAQITRLDVDEGTSTGTFKVKLVSPPSEDVTVALNGTAGSGVTLSSAGSTVTSLTFTSTNWNVGQTVTVNAAQDDNAFGETIQLSLDPSTASGDTEYDGIDSYEDFSIKVEDDETAGLTLKLVDTGMEADEMTVDEGTSSGSANQFTVELDSEPTSDVVVRMSQPGNNDIVGDANPSLPGPQTRLTFKTTKSNGDPSIPANCPASDKHWNCPQAVTVISYDDPDAIVDSGTITLVALGGDYNDISEDMEVTVEEDEKAEIKLVPENLRVQEDREPSELGVSLTSMPNGTVTVTAGAPTNTDLTVDTDLLRAGPQNTLTFDETNWDVSQPVTIAAADDDDDTSETGTVTFSASGANYQGAPDKVLNVDIRDTDIPGLDLKAAVWQVDEGASAEFEVRLTVEPVGGTVTVTLTQPSNTNVRVSPTTLTFNADEWDKYKTVEVTAAHDPDAIDDMTTVELSALGANNYTAALNILETVTIIVNDDEEIGLGVSSDSLTIDEGGSATFTVALTSRPSAEVTLTLLQASPGNDDIQIDSNPIRGGAQNTLVFTRDNWETPVPVTVKTKHDDDGQNDATTLNLVASGGDYSGQSTSVSVTVTDDERPGLHLTPALLMIDEAGTGSVAVRLRSRPSSGSVTVTASSPSSLLTVSGGGSLTFSQSTWNQDQMLTLQSFADFDGADERIAVELTTVGTGDYDGLSQDLIVNVDDDEEVSIVVSETSVTVRENVAGSTEERTYIEVSLSTVLKDDATAKVRVISSGPGIATVATDPHDTDALGGDSLDLTFTGRNSTADTPGNWNTPQRVWIFGVDDADSLDNSARIVLTGLDDSPEYANLTKEVSVEVIENDTPALILDTGTPGSDILKVDEGNPVGATLQVSLNSTPSGSVLVTLDIGNAEVAKIDRRQLSFDPLNWNVPQPVNVTPLQDDDGDDERTRITLAAAGAEFNGKTGSVTVEVEDDETREIVVSTDSLSINESGSGSFTVKLGSRPTNFVRVSLAPVDHSAVQVSPSELVFSPNNWGDEQTIAVTGRQDEDRRPENTEVRITARDAGYDGESAAVKVHVVDDEVAGLALSMTSMEITEQEGDGASKTFTVALNSLPSAQVTVGLTSTDDTAVTVTPAQLTFDAQSWETPQQVTVQSRQDDDSVNESVTILATASGAGAQHDGAVGRVEVSVIDDDGAELLLSVSDEDGLDVNEGGVSNFTLQLATVPSAEVTVSISGSNANLIRVAPSVLRFNPDNWNRPQAVSVIGVEDEDRQDHDALLTLSASGGEYSDVIKELALNVIDNDQGTTLKRESMAVQSVLEEMGRALLGSSAEVIGRRFDATGIGRKTLGIGSRDVEVGSQGSLGEAVVRLVQHFGAPSPVAERPAAGDHLGWLGSIELRDGRPNRIQRQVHSASERDPVISGFTYPVEGFGDELTAWARYDRSEFSGLLLPEEEKTLQENLSQKYDGTQGTAWLGFDQRLQNGVLFGVALSQSSGGSDYRVDGYRASMDTRLTILMPYVQVPLGRGFLRLMLGYGGGDLELIETSGVKSSSDMGIQLFSLGTKFPLARMGQSTTLSLTGSVGSSVMQTARAKVTALRELSSTSGRMTLGLEIAHDGFGDEWNLSPRFGLNFRQDTGDHSEGNGTELQGALRLSAPGARFSIDAGLRWLGTHGSDEYEEWSGSVELQLKSRDSAGRGLTLALGPEWGTLQSGALDEDEIFRPDQGYGSGARSGPDRSAMRARAGYGLDFYGGLLTPFAEYSLLGGDYASSRLRSGLKYQGSETFEARLFGEQEVSQGLQPRSRFGIELSKRF